MPFTPEQIQYAGKAAIDYIVRKNPEDIYNTDRPLLGALQRGKKSFPGAKQYIVEQLRIANDSNFQWFEPDEQVTYNRKRTLETANFEWHSAHDGFALSEEELLQNYITVTDDKNATPTTSEKHQFVNLMNENRETLFEGFKEKFDYELHLDGTQDADAVAGLDHIVSLAPTAGTMGGITRSLYPGWQNQVNLGINTGSVSVSEAMEVTWRKCTRIGGMPPDTIICGEKFYDAYRADAKSNIGREIIVPQRGGVGMDQGIKGLTFKGVTIQWDPILDQIQADGVAANSHDWDKRCYFLNSKHLKLRPAKGQDMKVRNPPRVYDRYTHYWGLTWRGGLTTTRPCGMAVLSIA